ncbi:MAG TPA: LON peptidase substrate-binding domain-containing protein [Pyrinomonadaceae bacterium]|jgi:Lon protease-like protein|nr:LON peptidase substrate-binding domain-containing protein [Pyrinomonadaceae bacterium]
MDRVRGVRELPLFPLPVVLFPGVPLPLHIFEPSYRQMLADIRARDSLFGLSFFDASAAVEHEFPPAGHVGCAAEVTEVEPLADGRFNIMTIGLIRYRVEAYLDQGDPYLLGEVSFFEDEQEDESLLQTRASQVTDIFLRIARAVRILNDERAALPELPETEPERLSFLVAAAVDLDIEVKQELLELRSTAERLKRLRDLLGRVVAGYEERARVHAIAKGNGHSGKKIDLE